MINRSLAAALGGLALMAPLAAFAHGGPGHSHAGTGTYGLGLAVVAAALLGTMALWTQVRPRRLDTEAPTVRGPRKPRRDRA